jgi:hypothetical protein
MALKAYETMRNQWSPDIAVRNFLQLSSSLLQNSSKKDIIEVGPCSIAQII